MQKLIIFDCDGVLVDSEIIANRIEAEAFTSFGYPISVEESIKKFTGMSTKTVRELIWEEVKVSLPQNLPEIVEPMILQALEVELKPLMLPVLNKLNSNGIKRCVASSSSRERVLRSLQITKQDCFFDEEHVFTSSQVAHGKPAPDLFLFAAERMGFLPKDCLVIEDSIAGIQAAIAAEMPVIAFMGGSHTQFEWYRKHVENQGVRIAYEPLDLLALIE